MTIKKSISLVISLAIISCLFACQTSSTPAPAPKLVSVALQSGLPTSLGVSTGLQLSATVTNDAATGGGVDWTATCGSNDCGSFSATHTASTVATTYTSPAAVPTGNTVILTAASTKDSTRTSSVTITITAPSSISVAFQATPPTSLAPSATTAITANVTNDSGNGGVDWTVTCGSGDCGSFTPTHTASGSATTYTGPAAVPVGTSVTVVATSTDDNTKSAMATITIAIPVTTYNLLLNGTYAFEISGNNTFSGVYQVGGVITADGNGNITGGEQVYNDSGTIVPGAILSGTYSFGADGRGAIILTTSTSSIGVAGVETLGAVITSGSHLLISGFDTSGTARGSMDLQTAVNPLTGGYAFVMNSTYPTAIGGVFNIDTPGSISGAGSVVDIDSFGLIDTGTLTGTVSAPDSFGEVAITLTTATGFFSPALTMSGFIVDDTHIKLVETDSFAASGGVAIAQGASAGTYEDNTAWSGNFVYGVFGACEGGGTAIAGALTADGAGNLSGLTDTNFQGLETLGSTMTGTYAVDGSGTGRIEASTVVAGAEFNPNFIFYLTQPNLPMLVLETDNYSLATGSASVQATGPYLFSGNYGLDFTSLVSGAESDGTSQITADGIGTFSGTVDVNSNQTSTPVVGLALTGTFTPDPSGRFASTVTPDSGTAYDAAFYFIDSTQGLLIETDTQQVTFGEFQAQGTITPDLRRGKVAVKSIKK